MQHAVFVCFIIDGSVWSLFVEETKICSRDPVQLRNHSYSILHAMVEIYCSTSWANHSNRLFCEIWQETFKDSLDNVVFTLQGFVSILDAPSVMYVWDQCHMQYWTTTVIENFCIALLELLRHKFMEAQDYLGMKEVFLLPVLQFVTYGCQFNWIARIQGFIGHL